MVKIISKNDILNLFYKITLERESRFNTKEKWLEPDKKTIERISKVVNEFIEKGWSEPTVRHRTKKHEILGKYLAEGDMPAFIEKWNSMDSWDRISDITFNPTLETPCFAGFSINCYYCLLTPYEYMQNQKLNVDKWKKHISDVGGKIGWICGVPLFVIERKKQNEISITDFIQGIKKLQEIYNFCDYDEIGEFFNHIRQHPQWHFY